MMEERSEDVFCDEVENDTTVRDVSDQTLRRRAEVRAHFLASCESDSGNDPHLSTPR